MRVVLQNLPILLLLHPELAVCQSQKSQIWRVPILPSDDANEVKEESGQGLQPVQRRTRRLEQLTDPLQGQFESPADTTVDARDLEGATSTKDALERLSIISTGGESGRWAGGGRLSLRGHPGGEPKVSVGGVLLSSGFSGAHAEDLIPLSAISKVTAYPFFPTLGLPHVGISGGYDFELFAGPQPVRWSAELQMESPSAVSLSGRESVHCSSKRCAQVSWSGGFFRGSQHILDDKNTPLDGADDRVAAFKLNDVSRVSVATQSQSRPGTGAQHDTTVLAGGEARGTSGLPLSSGSEHDRTLRNLGFVSHRYSHLSAHSGLQVMFQGSGRSEYARNWQDLKTTSGLLRREERRENVLALKGVLTLPVSLADKTHQVFAYSHVDKSLFGSTTSLARLFDAIDDAHSSRPPTHVSGDLLSVSAGAGSRLEVTRSDTLTLTGTSNLNQFSLNRTCGVFSPAVLCSAEQSADSQNSFGSVFDWRHQRHSELILYAQAGRLSRPPGPVEWAGRPDGILANLQLTPESTTALDVGFQSLFGGASVFFAQDKNLITAEQVSPHLIQYQNTGEVRRGGIVVDAEARIFAFEIQAHGQKIYTTVVRGRPGQTVVPFVPSNRLSISLARSFSFPLTTEGTVELRTRVRMDQSSSYWVDSQGVARLTPPPQLSTVITSPWSLAGSVVEVSFGIRNLLGNNNAILQMSDQSRRPVAWTESPVLPIADRTFELNVRLLNRATPE